MGKLKNRVIEAMDDARVGYGIGDAEISPWRGCNELDIDHMTQTEYEMWLDMIDQKAQDDEFERLIEFNTPKGCKSCNQS